MSIRNFFLIILCLGSIHSFAQAGNEGNGEQGIQDQTASVETSPGAMNHDPTPTDLDGFLQTGMIREGLAHFANSTDNAGRFSLAFLQVADGVQRFSGGMNQLGFRQDLDRSFQGLPFFRIVGPGGLTGGGETATPEKIAALFSDLRGAFQLANETVSAVDDEEFKVEVNLGKIRLDLTGDGNPGEPLMDVLAATMGMMPQGDEEVIIRFDSGDAAWLQGYTHVLTGMLEVLLAYDWQPVWDQAAHMIFENPEPAPAVAAFDPTPADFGMDTGLIADLIATIHAINLEVSDPEGLARARDSFLGMVASSRLSWERILAETDNDHEWVPSPTQTGPLGATITQEEIDGWMDVLDELEAVLTGEKLMPHWRLSPGQGINVDKLVTDPPRLDLIMLLQGSAIAPYIESGDVSDMDTWEALTGPFGGNFAGFAIWVN
ncbi:MAG: hypothetical protein JJU11_04795 [Candidatus Sumerlaeia bacterium]|nr:hypothetical protein [Candidatus Sumerlaeia bacterium]